MKIISPKVHVVLDYLTFLFLLVAPSLFPLSAFGTNFCYLLAGIHLLLTIVTNFNGKGVFKVMPFRIHGIVEFFVGMLLGVSAFTYFMNYMPDHLFFATLGLVILIVFLLTDFKRIER